MGKADAIGSLAPGKVADIVVIRGDPSANINDIEKVEIVFKDGVGYDLTRLLESVRGVVDSASFHVAQWGLHETDGRRIAPERSIRERIDHERFHRVLRQADP